MSGDPWRLCCDGACRGNPGPSGYGFVLYDGDGTLVEEGSGPLGRATNNQAEYLALEAALACLARHAVEEVVVCMDSQLVVRQVLGAYQVRQPTLRRLWHRVREQLASLKAAGVEVALRHVPREENAEADRLANAGVEA